MDFVLKDDLLIADLEEVFTLKDENILLGNVESLEAFSLKEENSLVSDDF